MNADDILRLIRDLLEPCTCPGRGGHTDPECPWYDLPDRASLAARAAREAAIQAGDRCREAGR